MQLAKPFVLFRELDRDSVTLDIPLPVFDFVDSKARTLDEAGSLAYIRLSHCEDMLPIHQIVARQTIVPEMLTGGERSWKVPQSANGGRDDRSSARADVEYQA